MGPSIKWVSYMVENWSQVSYWYCIRQIIETKLLSVSYHHVQNCPDVPDPYKIELKGCQHAINIGPHIVHSISLH